MLADGGNDEDDDLAARCVQHTPYVARLNGV